MDTFVHDFDNQTDGNVEKEISYIEKLDQLIECESDEKKKRKFFEAKFLRFETTRGVDQNGKLGERFGVKSYATYFSGIDGYAECMTKFDELFLNKTMVCFKADKQKRHCHGCVVQRTWRYVPLKKNIYPRLLSMQCLSFALRTSVARSSGGVSMNFSVPECARSVGRC